MADFDAAVIGAGVIGLAIARRLARAGLSTLIVEAEDRIGTGTSSRNSEVIHAGLYYDGLPLKASLCVEGRAQLYRYCAERGVPHRRLGKLIVAFTDAEIATLETTRDSGERAGVDDLQMLTGAEAQALEPALSCSAALFSPSTGIIDSHAYMIALLGDAEAAGATLARHSPVRALSRANGDWSLHLNDSDGPVATATRVVNACGHGARDLAEHSEGLAAAVLPLTHYARGNYYVYQGRTPFSHLIYPVPVPGGLGTHLTLDLGGNARFGPDVDWIDSLDFSISPGRDVIFREAAARIWPDLDPARLVPGYCGIRPKISSPGEPAADFLIAGFETLDAPNMVVLMGIESPGLTASLAIADLVATKLGIG